MASLKDEYTDSKGRIHPVEHQVFPADNPADRERIREELFLVLTKTEGPGIQVMQSAREGES